MTYALLFSPADPLAYVAAIPLSFLVMLLIVLVGSRQTRTRAIQSIRRHTGTDTYWSTIPTANSEATRALNVPHIPRHSSEPSEELHPETEQWPSTGRRAVDNPFRQIVPSDWQPPTGETRIAMILDTPTSEWLVVKQPKGDETERVRDISSFEELRQWLDRPVVGPPNGFKRRTINGTVTA